MTKQQSNHLALATADPAPAPAPALRRLTNGLRAVRQALQARAADYAEFLHRQMFLRAAHVQRLRDERGAVTAEYAVLILAGVAIAGVMILVMRSGAIQDALTQLVQNALNSAG